MRTRGDIDPELSKGERQKPSPHWDSKQITITSGDVGDLIKLRLPRDTHFHKIYAAFYTAATAGSVRGRLAFRKNNLRIFSVPMELGKSSGETNAFVTRACAGNSSPGNSDSILVNFDDLTQALYCNPSYVDDCEADELFFTIDSPCSLTGATARLFLAVESYFSK